MTNKPPAGPKSAELYDEARRIIPGGTQLLSKRPEMFAPEQWPAYFEIGRASCRERVSECV